VRQEAASGAFRWAPEFASILVSLLYSEALKLKGAGSIVRMA
jgi:hypothetical protein